MADPGWAIEAEALAKDYGRNPVLRDVSLTLAAGEGLVLLGANGAGKTTLLKILATLIRPTRGSARVGGHDLAREAQVVRRHVGLLAHGSHLYEDLTAIENLQFFAALDGRGTKRVEDALTAFKDAGAAILIVTHNLAHALTIGDRIAILARGRLATERRRDGLDLETLRRFYAAHTEEE